MPLPCPQVLSDLLDLYLDIRNEETWGSTIGIVRGSTQKIFGKLGALVGKSSEDDATYKANVCKVLKANFNVAKTTDDWIKIIFQLANQAAAEQASTNKESLACLTLHAARNYIVKTLTSNNDESCLEFKKHCEALNAKCAQLDAEIDDRRHNSRGVGVKPLKDELNELLIKLALLGDRTAIFRVQDYQLMTYLRLRDQVDIQKSKYADDINEEIPFCLQDKFCEILYGETYQKRTNIGFVEFEIRSIEKYKQLSVLERTQKEKEAEKIANLKQQLILVASSPPKSTIPTLVSEKPLAEQVKPAVETHEAGSLFEEDNPPEIPPPAPSVAPPPPPPPPLPSSLPDISRPSFVTKKTIKTQPSSAEISEHELHKSNDSVDEQQLVIAPLAAPIQKHTPDTANKDFFKQLAQEAMYKKSIKQRKQAVVDEEKTDSAEEKVDATFTS